MSELSFYGYHKTIDEAIENNFYIPKIELSEYPEEPIYEISGNESVDDIQQKLLYILKYKEAFQQTKENNDNFFKRQKELTNMFWLDCFIESNINILPLKIKEAIIDMIVEKAKELGYMGNFPELKILFGIFSKEMVDNFSKIGSKSQEKTQPEPSVEFEEDIETIEAEKVR